MFAHGATGCRGGSRRTKTSRSACPRDPCKHLLRLPHESFRIRDRERTAHSGAHQGAGAIAGPGSRSRRMTAAKVVELTGNAHATVQIGQPQGGPAEFLAALARHHDGEPPDVEVE